MGEWFPRYPFNEGYGDEVQPGTHMNDGYGDNLTPESVQDIIDQAAAQGTPLSAAEVAELECQVASSPWNGDEPL